MGRPNDLFGPETQGDSPMPMVRPTPVQSPTEVAPADDGLITVSGMESVALVFVRPAGIRDHEVDMFQRRLTAVAERSHGRIAISLSELSSINSAGINALVAVHTHCTSLGGHLALFAMTEEVRKVFRVTKLDKKMVLANNAHEAVRSYSKPKKSFLKGAFSWAKQEKDAA